MTPASLAEDPVAKRAHLASLGFSLSPHLTWLHMRAAFIAGIGFFTDAYDMFAINVTLLILGYVYYGTSFNMVPPLTDMSVKLSSLFGIIVGQVLFGWLADRIGRRRVYAIEMALIITGTVASCFASNAVRGITVFGMLCIWRFLLGLGLGGDITLTGVIASEFAHTSRRGAILAAVFAMQGLGILAAAGVSALVLAAFHSTLHDDPFALDYVWRIILAVGLLPAVTSLVLRLRIPETPRYLQEQHLRKQANPIEADPATKVTWTEFFTYFRLWHRNRVLIGTAIAWFCADLVFYGTQLNAGTMLRMFGLAERSEPYIELMYNITGQILLALTGTIPGYIAAVFLVDRVGRRNLQLFGFILLTLTYLALAVTYWYLLLYSSAGFIALFAVAQFFLALGPSITTFMIPAEVFPTRYRATAFGIAAATGKVGAITAQIGFAQIQGVDGPGLFLDRLFYIFTGVMVLGVFATVLVPETRGKSLEKLEQEMNDGPPPPPPKVERSESEFDV